MYKVYISPVLFCEFKDDVSAIGVALDLHRISNCAHTIRVFKDDELIITLERN